MDYATIEKMRSNGRNIPELIASFDTMFPLTPFSSSCEAIFDYLKGGLTDKPLVPLADSDRPLYESIEILREIVDWESFEVRPNRCRKIIDSPASDERLCNVTPATWTNLYLLNYIVLSLIRPTKISAVVVGMRDDGVRILEWIAHYLAVGFEHIFIYSNDNHDKSEVLLEALIGSGVITYIKNDVSGTVSPQAKAFEHSLRLLPELRQYEWVFYVDSDEFLLLPEYYDYSINQTINALTNRHVDRLPSALIYNWKWFVSANTYQQTFEPLIERFQYAKSHDSYKSIVRLQDVYSMMLLHFPLCGPNAFFVDSAFDTITLSTSADKSDMWGWRAPQYSGGQINHYWHKSFEEFAIKKRRGDSLLTKSYDYSFKFFFDWNEAETVDLWDPCPELFLGRVYRSIFILKALPGVSSAEQTVMAAHERLLDVYGGTVGLRRIYDDLSTTR